MKRGFDVVVAGAALLLLAPLLALVALAVKLSSPGPALFRQQRIGRGGEPFMLLKFRTMVSGAAGPNVSAVHDARVTRVGAVLRRSFLDEAPQLVNVVRGDMSLVGPRPETPEYAALLDSDERRILAVRPGMAGPSTIAFSAAEAALLAGRPDPDRYYREHLLHLRARADLGYAPGLGADLRILGRTALMVAAGLVRRPRRRAAPRPSR
jgi:lipopolysaccharide/colanic/teichoic acid biosynthesis glycosyltransferase